MRGPLPHLPLHQAHAFGKSRMSSTGHSHGCFREQSVSVWEDTEDESPLYMNSSVLKPLIMSNLFMAQQN